MRQGKQFSPSDAIGIATIDCSCNLCLFVQSFFLPPSDLSNSHCLPSVLSSLLLLANLELDDWARSHLQHLLKGHRRASRIVLSFRAKLTDPEGTTRIICSPACGHISSLRRDQPRLSPRRTSI